MRAYSPVLSQYQVTQTEFLNFLDGLNEVFIANPVLQTTSIAGSVMGMIHPVEVVGMAVEAASEIGSETTSYFRTRAYLKRANAELFGPEGIKANIMEFEKMARAVGVNPDELKERMEKESAVLEGQDGEGFDDIDIEMLDSVIADSGSGNGGGEAKRMNPRLLLLDALQGHVAPLETGDLPASSVQRNLLKRWNASFAAKEGQKQNDRLERKFREAKEERVRKYKEALDIAQETEREIGKIEAKIDKMSENGDDKMKTEKKISCLSTDMAKLRRKKAKKMREAMKDGDEEMQNLQRKDMDKTLKIKWLVISPSECIPSTGGQRGS